MTIVNKIAILIAWPRELDMYRHIIDSLRGKIVIIVDDFEYSQKQRENASGITIELLIANDIKYELLSDVYARKQYKVLLSTGASYKENMSLDGLIKLLYARTVGLALQKTKISKFLVKIFGRGFTGGGANFNHIVRENIERTIGVNNVFLPMGMDLSLSHFPLKRWEKQFDVFFCHGPFDMSRLKEKFNDKEFYNIGYPRYNGLPSTVDAKKIIEEEFGIVDCNKPLILWIPTDIKLSEESGLNIVLWANIIKKYCNNFNVIVRPHPKTIVTNPEIKDILIRNDFIVDLEHDRKLGVLYQAADLVLADYGGSVLSSIYLERPLLLLNLPVDSNYVRSQIRAKTLDVLVRDKLPSIAVEDKKSFQKFILQVTGMEYQNIVKQVRIKYFGLREDSLNMKEISMYLSEKLD